MANEIKVAGALGQDLPKLHGIRRPKELYRATPPHHVVLVVLSRVRLKDLWMLTDKQTLWVWADSIALCERVRWEAWRTSDKKWKKERIKNKTKQKRKDQLILKLVEVCKAPIYKITCSLPRSPFAYHIHVYCFLQIFPGKGKDHSEGLTTLPRAPLCFFRAPFKGVNIRPISYGHGSLCSTACSAPLWCQKLCHPSQWLYWFGQHKFHIAQPQGCHFAMDIRAVLRGGVAISLEMKSPQCWTRGENLRILFQISWTSQDSFIGVCMLFVLGDEIRYLFGFKWPIYASCSMHPF